VDVPAIHARKENCFPSIRVELPNRFQVAEVNVALSIDDDAGCGMRLCSERDKKAPADYEECKSEINATQRDDPRIHTK
jgi:hypothetical protein